MFLKTPQYEKASSMVGSINFFTFVISLTIIIWFCCLQGHEIYHIHQEFMNSSL